MLDIQQITEGEVTILVLRGDLDTLTAPQLENVVRTIGAATEPRLVLDMEGVNFVSSFGLRVIVYAAKMLRMKGNHFALAQAQAEVMAILQLGGFDNFITICPNRETAVSTVSK